MEGHALCLVFETPEQRERFRGFLEAYATKEFTECEAGEEVDDAVTHVIDYTKDNVILFKHGSTSIKDRR